MAQMTLKSLRIAKGLTQREAAKALGVTPPTLGRWEARKNNPDIEQAARLAMLYDATLNDVVRFFLPENFTESE